MIRNELRLLWLRAKLERMLARVTPQDSLEPICAVLDAIQECYSRRPAWLFAWSERRRLARARGQL